MRHYNPPYPATLFQEQEFCSLIQLSSSYHIQKDFIIIFSIPHSGRFYPNTLFHHNHKTLDELRIFEDPYLDRIFPPLIQYDAFILINHCARAYIDVNRALTDAPEKHALNGQNTGLIPYFMPNGTPVYDYKPKTHHIHQRIDTIYHPYHTLLKKMIAFHKPMPILLIDIHSMPSFGTYGDPDTKIKRPDIILSDYFGESCDKNIMAIFEKAFGAENFTTRRNFPYSGGYITQYYGNPHHNIHALQIEINRMLYVDEENYQLLPEFSFFVQKISSALNQALWCL